MKRLLTFPTVLLVLAGCSDASRSPLEPTQPAGGGASLAVMQGAESGGGAYFLPPLMSSTYSGVFHPNRSPEIKICSGHSGDDPCASPVAAFDMTSGAPAAQTIRMVAADEHYIVNWNTQGVPQGNYRVYVVENGYTLAWTDVVVVESGRAMRDHRGLDLPVINGSLPIKVRLEEVNGVLAKYYHMTSACSGCAFPNGTFVAARIEPRIDHAHTGSSSGTFGNSFWPGVVRGDLFSAQWTGYVTPLYSETYTFCSTNDDGVRLWVNDVLLVDHWIPQPATERCGAIALEAGQKYSLRKEFFENTQAAAAELRWQSASQAKELIPNSALHAF